MPWLERLGSVAAACTLNKRRGVGSYRAWQRDTFWFISRRHGYFGVSVITVRKPPPSMARPGSDTSLLLIRLSVSAHLNGHGHKVAH